MCVSKSKKKEIVGNDAFLAYPLSIAINYLVLWVSESMGFAERVMRVLWHSRKGVLLYMNHW